MIQIDDILDAYWKRISSKARSSECRPELADAFDAILKDAIGDFGAEIATKALHIQDELSRIESTASSIQMRHLAMDEAQLKSAIETWKSITAAGLSRRHIRRLSSEVSLMVDRLKVFKTFYGQTRQGHLHNNDRDGNRIDSEDLFLAAIELMIGTAYIRWLEVPAMGAPHLKSAAATFRSAAYRLSEESVKALLLAGRCEELQRSIPTQDDLIGHPSYHEANAILGMPPPFGMAAPEPRTTTCDATGAAWDDEHLDRRRAMFQMLSSHSAQLSKHARQHMANVLPKYESLLWLSDCAERMLDV